MVTSFEIWSDVDVEVWIDRVYRLWIPRFGSTLQGPVDRGHATVHWWVCQSISSFIIRRYNYSCKYHKINYWHRLYDKPLDCMFPIATMDDEALISAVDDIEFEYE